MLDVKNWLKEGTGLSVANTAFINKVTLPFIVFLEDTEIKGSDLDNDIVDKSVTIELYSSTISKSNETKIEKLLNEKSIKYKKSRMWLDDERCFETMYDFSFLERIDN